MLIGSVRTGTPIMKFDHPHQLNDRMRLFTHRAIAAKIDASPSLLGKAGANLERWRIRSFDGVLPPALQEWRDLLDALPWPALRDILTSDCEESNRLRQSTPFTGILTQTERRTAREAASS